MTAEHGRPARDLYQLLGVHRRASREQIAQAWRRRARAEHPDSRPSDTSAPARFRVLAEAYEVLGDPARRAAYDQALGPDHPARPDHPAQPAPAPAVRVPVHRRAGPGGPAGTPPAAGPPEVPLRAGPVWVQVPPPGPAAAAAAEAAEAAEARLAVLAELAARYLAGERGWPW